MAPSSFGESHLIDPAGVVGPVPSQLSHVYSRQEAGGHGDGRGCQLEAAFRHTIIVVDNGSGDLMPRDVAPAELLCLPENRGYAGGNNAGIHRALSLGADFVFLVNSDVAVAPDCLKQLVAAAESHWRAAILGPLVLRQAQPERVESSGQSFSRRSARHRELDRGALAQSIDLAPRWVDAVSGCAMLVRSAALPIIGELDERLFLYFEDLDWCLRASERGFGVLAVPAASVYHRGGGSVGEASPQTTYYSVRNHLVVAARHVQPRIFRLAVPLVALYHLAYLTTNPARRTRAHLGALLRGAWAAISGRGGA